MSFQYQQTLGSNLLKRCCSFPASAQGLPPVLQSFLLFFFSLSLFWRCLLPKLSFKSDSIGALPLSCSRVWPDFPEAMTWPLCIGATQTAPETRDPTSRACAGASLLPTQVQVSHGTQVKHEEKKKKRQQGSKGYRMRALVLMCA